jgi:hypothetical protein
LKEIEPHDAIVNEALPSSFPSVLVSKHWVEGTARSRGALMNRKAQNLIKVAGQKHPWKVPNTVLLFPLSMSWLGVKENKMESALTSPEPQQEHFLVNFLLLHVS